MRLMSRETFHSKMADVQRRLTNILNKPNNKTCADCDSKNPRWVSLSLGVLVCIRCCGHHRNLGTHISKMKSVTLDKWQADWCLIFENLDNVIANTHWEGVKPDSVRKPTERSANPEVERYIRDKYEHKLWARQGEDSPVQAVLKGTHRPASAPVEKPAVVLKPSSPSQRLEAVDLLAMEEPVKAVEQEEMLTWHSPPEPSFPLSSQFTADFPVFTPNPPTQPVPPQLPDKAANIKAILAMYQQPQGSQPVRPVAGFRPLGAIAAEQMMKGGSVYAWPSY